MLISDGVGEMDVVGGGEEVDDMKEGLEGGFGGGGLPSPSGLVGIVGGGDRGPGDDGDSCCSAAGGRGMDRLDNDASKASAAPRLVRFGCCCDGGGCAAVDWSWIASPTASCSRCTCSPRLLLASSLTLILLIGYTRSLRAAL